ncbi:MAG: type II secretion system protein [Steroidobacteraceae bacterium]
MSGRPHAPSFAPAFAQGGFTYIGILIAVAIIGISLSSVGVVWSLQARRDREEQLLFAGNQYRQAIGRYVQAGGLYPQSLDDLVEDKRVPVPRRFLRRLYPDPMTGASDWELIRDVDGGIMGVASSSQQQPIKVAGFRLANAAFAKAECYCSWKFVHVSNTAAGRRRVLPSIPSSAPNPSNP